MSFNYIIDTSAWIEYFGATQKGLKIKDIIEQQNIASSIIAIAEIADKFERENKSCINIIRFIQSRAQILPLTINTCLIAAKLKKEHRTNNSKFGIADAIHLASAQQHQAVLVTTDSDFSGIQNILII